MVRCPECRTRRKLFTSMLRHVAQTGHSYCFCNGYHFKHRPGSPCCESNPMSAYHLTARYSDDVEELAEVAIECAINRPGRLWNPASPIPF